MITSKVWRLLGWHPSIDEAAGVDMVSLSLQADGKVYSVTIGGQTGMTVGEMVEALRAAAAHAVRSNGGDVTKIPGCSLFEEDLHTPPANRKLS